MLIISHPHLFRTEFLKVLEIWSSNTRVNNSSALSIASNCNILWASKDECLRKFCLISGAITCYWAAIKCWLLIARRSHAVCIDSRLCANLIKAPEAGAGSVCRHQVIVTIVNLTARDCGTDWIIVCSSTICTVAAVWTFFSTECL